MRTCERCKEPTTQAYHRPLCPHCMTEVNAVAIVEDDDNYPYVVHQYTPPRGMWSVANTAIGAILMSDYLSCIWAGHRDSPIQLYRIQEALGDISYWTVSYVLPSTHGVEVWVENARYKEAMAIVFPLLTEALNRSKMKEQEETPTEVNDDWEMP